MKTITLVAVLCLLIIFPAFAALKLNVPAPAFSLLDATGKDRSLADILGSRTKAKAKVNGVIVSFFASWCTPCRQELPLLNSLADELKEKGITIVLVDVKEDFNVINTLLAELKVNKPVVLSDRAGKIAESYQVRFFPTTFFIGSDGTVKDIIFGGIKDEAELRKSSGKLVQ